MLTGQNGILSKAQTAQTKSAEAEAEEALKLALSEILSNKLDPTYDSAGGENVINKANIEKLVPKNNSNVTATVTGDSAPFTVTLKIQNKTITRQVDANGKITIPEQ